MATTAKDVIDSVSAQLHGWGATADRVTPLSVNIGPTDLQFQVDYSFGQAVGIAPGVVEIDSEQIYIVSIDANSNVATVAAGGRGYKGTTAASHTAGSMVVSRPKFPRSTLLKQVNEIIGSVFPQLFVPKTWTGVVTAPSDTYTLSGSPLLVLDAQWQDPIGNWRRCRRYEIDPFDLTLRVHDAPIGRPLRVVYGAEPTPFTAESDDFTVTGLPTSAYDVLTLGAVAKLVPGLDISRAQSSSVEQSDRSRVVPPNAGITAGRYLMAEFQDRLANEAKSLRKRYKPTIRWV